jgi:hypothetical protein
MWPADSWLQTLSGLFLWPALRLVGLGYTAYHDRICAEEARKRAAAAAVADLDVEVRQAHD